MMAHFANVSRYWMMGWMMERRKLRTTIDSNIVKMFVVRQATFQPAPKSILDT
jgi:hypothetical protein